jgi:hypothetical protein
MGEGLHELVDPLHRRASLPRLTDRIAIGGRPLAVSPFCLGYVSTPDTVLAAYDAGINFFFVTADMHWPLYEGTRLGLARLLSRGGGVRDMIVVAVTSYVTQPVFCRLPFLEALAAVPALERIDLLVAGGAYREEIGPRLEAVRRTRERDFPGAALGASYHDRGAALAAVNQGAVDVAYIRYNPLHPGARDDLFPRIVRDGRDCTRLYNFTSTSAYRPPDSYSLPDEFWLPAITDYYRFALSPPEMDGVLCALQTPDHVAELAAALEKGPLDPDEEEHLLRLADIVRGRGL